MRVDATAESPYDRSMETTMTPATEAAPRPRPRCVAVNDECDTCSHCGKRGLKRVAWLLHEGETEAVPYGTTCAAHLMAGNVGRKPSYGKAEEILADEVARYHADRLMPAARSAWDAAIEPEIYEVGQNEVVRIGPAAVGVVRGLPREQAIAQAVRMARATFAARKAVAGLDVMHFRVFALIRDSLAFEL